MIKLFPVQKWLAVTWGIFSGGHVGHHRITLQDIVIFIASWEVAAAFFLTSQLQSLSVKRSSL